MFDIDEVNFKMKKCEEIKHTYFGERVIAHCYLCSLSEESGVLKYYFDDTWVVNGLILGPPMFTLAYYPDNKPYNVYCWFTDSNELIAYYFNIVDNTSLSPDLFSYQDLIVDLLVYPDLTYEVLDEDEIPENIDKETLDYINNAKSHILNNLSEVIHKVDQNIQPFL